MCVMFSSHVSSHISQRVICVLVCGSMAVMRSAFVPAALINAWISVDPCCTVASVRKRLQASGIGSASRRVCGKHLARHVSGHCSLCSIPRFKRSFLCGFFWFFAVSLGSHVHVSSPIETTGGQADLLKNCSSSRICCGQPCLGIVLAHVFLAIFGACVALPQIQFKPSVERRVRFWRIFGTFFSLSLPRIWLSRSTSKIDALDDDETQRGQAAVRLFEKIGSAWVRRLKACVAARKAVFLSSSTEQ